MNAALLHPGPGGAPGAHPRTPRASYPGALSASSMLCVASFLASWATLSLLPQAPPRPPLPVVGPIIAPGPTLVPPPLTPTPSSPSAPPTIAPTGIVVPSRIPDAPPGEAPLETAPAAEAGPGGGSPGPAGPDAFGSEAVPEALPAPGAYVPHDLEPEALVRIEPEYPDLAREAGIEGAVTLLVLVGVSGRVVDVRVLRSAPVFDAAAIEALRHWVFRPALAGTRPVAVWVAVPVRFTLHGH